MGREQTALRPYAQDAVQVLGAQARLARTERRWTQKDLAVRAGMSERTVRMIETGTATPSIGNVFNCSAVLGMRLFGADPAELARLHQDARKITSLIPQRVRERASDNDF